jgi:GNAT superfamily N-acetyltransferase
MDRYTFVRPDSNAEWAAYHEIRRRVLFVGRGRAGVYDDAHPDDLAPNNHPRLLSFQGTPVATVRLDHVPTLERGIVRLVAVDDSARGQGHGAVLMRQVESLALDLGCTQLVSNSAKHAVPFYERHGFTVEVWDADQPPRDDGVQVTKRLRDQEAVPRNRQS